MVTHNGMSISEGEALEACVFNHLRFILNSAVDLTESVVVNLDSLMLTWFGIQDVWV